MGATTRAVYLTFKELSKPPGPVSIWYSLGSVIRSIGKVIDSAGAAVQADSVYEEKLPIPCTAVSLDGKAPTIGQSFVAPSASLVGPVTLMPGASVWYGAIVRAHGGGAITIGELSNVQENVSLTASGDAPLSVGRLVTIGAGSSVSGATLADECTIGCGCVVPAGSTVGKGAVLAAGSVLEPKATVPAGQLWAGKPAKKVANLAAADAEAGAAAARAMVGLSAIHQEHAWMPLDEIEFTSWQYKTEAGRPRQYSQSLREAPDFGELPKLRERLVEVGAVSS